MIARVPQGVVDLDAAVAFHNGIRSALSDRFAKFPWWKEIGTFAVLVSEPSLFATVRGHGGRFRDKTGLHMNVMLGTIFIDDATKENTGRETWGLYHSGKHFTAVGTAVAEWCEGARAAPSG